MSHPYFKIQDSHFKLSKIPTLLTPVYQSEKDYDKILAGRHADLEEMQNMLYAQHRHSLLIIFQGMDTSGKDGAIKHVMSGINPQGCSVTSFKTPSATELDHDFLWRSHLQLPGNGEIKIFNRSYYEEVLITKVHPKLLKAENLPIKKFDSDFWKNRYHDIVQQEAYLVRQGIEIIKIFIHISNLEQKKRLIARFDDPKKQWKIDKSDVREREFWKDYQIAYEESIRATATKKSPWYIVPGDDKKNARLAISEILISRLKALDLKYPKLDAREKKNLKKYRALLKS